MPLQTHTLLTTRFKISRRTKLSHRPQISENSFTLQINSQLISACTITPVTHSDCTSVELVETGTCRVWFVCLVWFRWWLQTLWQWPPRVRTAYLLPSLPSGTRGEEHVKPVPETFYYHKSTINKQLVHCEIKDSIN